MRSSDVAATSSRPAGPVFACFGLWTPALVVYAKLMRMSLRAQLQYAADFALGFVVAMMAGATEIVTFAVILSRFPSFGGWRLWDVAALYGVAIGGYTLHRVGAGDLHSLSALVRSGEFDQLLLRPWSPLLALLCRSGRVGQLANLAVPALTLGAACAHLRAAGELTAAGLWLGIPLVFASATTLQYAVAIGTQAAAFWIVRADELEVLTIHAPNTAAEYPATVYPGWLRAYLTCMVPVAACVFWPMRALLGKGGDWADVAAAPLAAAAALAVALSIWRCGERRYMGTGT